VTRVVVDASAYAAMVFGEPEAALVAHVLDGATVFAPPLLTFELASAALKKMRRSGDGGRVLGALAAAFGNECAIVWHDVDVVDVARVAEAAGISVYDASYLWLAGVLGADLVTLDARLARAGAALAI